MSNRLRNILEAARQLDEEYIRTKAYGPNEPRDVILVGALVYLAQLVDDYIDAQADHVERADAYRRLFEAVRAPVTVP
jgi:hypothetical protein